MTKIAVMSGKGGTGKTTVTASLAWFSNGLVLADCDVDAANLALALGGKVRIKKDYTGSMKARIDRTLCTECGKCEDACTYDAISELQVNEMRCEGCGACRVVCPSGAVQLIRQKSGTAYVLDTEKGPMAYAELFPGEANSGKLVTEVRRLADDLAESDDLDMVLIDGPPGTGCPAIASISGVDLILAITEPSLSGEHDLMRLLDLVKHFSIPVCVAINKWDLHPGMTRSIEERCRSNDVQVIGHIPYDPSVLHAIKQMRPLPSLYPRSPASIELGRIWQQINRKTVERKGNGLLME